MKYFDQLANKSEAFKFSVYANIAQFAIIVITVLLLALVSQTKVVTVEIPPGNLEGETFKIGINDANDRTYEVWGEVFSNRVGNFSPTNFREKFKAVEPFLYPDQHFQIKTEFESAAKKITENFITSKFDYKFSKVEKHDGIATVKAFGVATRVIGTRAEFEDMPYVYEIDMVVKGGSIFIQRIAGHIDETGLVGDNGKGVTYKGSSKFVDFAGNQVQQDQPNQETQPLAE